MITFTLCLLALIAGYFLYGRFIEHIFGPDDRKTPALTKTDGVDYIPLPTWKIFMIQFLNIAGLGPIFGAIMGAKFGVSSYLWIDAIGQVFYSLSIMMAIMFAYGSYLGESANVAKDCVIIALSDAAVSVLSGIVMFSTMGGVGMLDSITDSGIATAFIVYPQAIVNLTDIGWFNALFLSC